MHIGGEAPGSSTRPMENPRPDRPIGGGLAVYRHTAIQPPSRPRRRVCGGGHRADRLAALIARSSPPVGVVSVGGGPARGAPDDVHVHGSALAVPGHCRPRRLTRRRAPRRRVGDVIVAAAVCAPRTPRHPWFHRATLGSTAAALALRVAPPSATSLATAAARLPPTSPPLAASLTLLIERAF